MFGGTKRVKRASETKFISHWLQLIEKLKYSSQEFYGKIETALQERQIPELKFERVEWPEGGMLSDRREYLRISRERLAFDVCGAPFGSGFFVSIWCGEKKNTLGRLAIAFVAVAVLGWLDWLFHPDFGLYQFLWKTLSISYTQTTLTILGILGVILVGIVVRTGPNLDALLIGLPGIGYVYERFFRVITYYRVDKQCMYRQAVHEAVMQVIDELTTLQCIKPLSELERRPIMRDLFDR